MLVTVMPVHYAAVVIPLIPFALTDRRTVWLRGTLLLATALGLIASHPLWSNTRSYPLSPICDGFPILPAPWDHVLFGVMLATLLLAAWFHRVGTIAFLATSFLAYCGDVNRGQPWLYMYWVMLLLTLFPKAVPMAGCRWALATVYLWSGIQKCNGRFFAETPAWFVSPATNWQLPAFAMDALRWSAASAPLLEIAIAAGLWFKPARHPALAAIILVHLFALLFLGPWGHDYNWVVWPWNLAMISLALALFPVSQPAKEEAASLANSWIALRRSPLALAIALPFMLLPALSYKDRWPSQFSFALYSNSSANANIFVTQALVDNLPPQLVAYAQPFPNHDPQCQGPFIFNAAPWAYEELHVPPATGTRPFLSVFNALKPYAPAPEDLRMIVGERSGRVLFYQGDTAWPLTAR
jgi:hypothetical protein